MTRQIIVATTSDVLLQPERRPPQQAAEHRAVADPVAGGVEHRAEPGAAAALAGHRPVEHVGEHEDEHRERAPPQLPDREQRQRGEHRARGADDGDAVGGETCPQRGLGDRRDSFA